MEEDSVKWIRKNVEGRGRCLFKGLSQNLAEEVEEIMKISDDIDGFWPDIWIRTSRLQRTANESMVTLISWFP
jgi:hypothetical protein